MLKAWMFYDLDDMRLEEVPKPKLRPGWVMLKPRVVQVSITEAIHVKGVPTFGHQHILRRLEEKRPQQLFGHEYSADVVEVGAGVKDLNVGDRVTGRSRLPCYKCWNCLNNRENECKEGPVVGIGTPGCFAEYFTLPASVLIKLPDTITDEEAASIQPLSSVVPTVQDAQIRLGDSIAVFGQGQMGLYITQVAKVSGAGLIIGVDIHPGNLQIASSLGADELINAKEQNPVEAILKLTKNLGADVVFEVAGGSEAQGLSGSSTLSQALEAVKYGGTIVQVAHIPGLISLDLSILRNKSLRYIFPKPATAELEEYTIRLLTSKRVSIKPMLTHRLEGLDKLPEAFEIVLNKTKYGAINAPQLVV